MNLSWQHDMKASPNSTVRYRNSICTITAVQTTLTYVIETTYSRGYEQRSPYPAPKPYTPNIINLSWYIGSISSRLVLEKQRSVRITDGKANSPVSWGSLHSYLTIVGVVTGSKIGLWMNLSLTESSAACQNYLYIYTYSSSHLLVPIYFPRALRSKHQP
jgi:hypothetical protein